MRKPLCIDKEKAGYLYQHLERRAGYLDVSSNCSYTKEGFCGLSGALKTICKSVIQDEIDAAKELGFECPWETEEQKESFEYVKSFAK